MLAFLLLLALTVPASAVSTVPDTSVEMIVPGGEGQKYWPGWRRPSDQGLISGTGYVDTWSDTQNVLLKVVVPGTGTSSPILWGDYPFVARSHDGGARKSISHGRTRTDTNLVYFRRSDGTPLREAFAPDAPPGQVNAKSQASGAPSNGRQARVCGAGNRAVTNSH